MESRWSRGRSRPQIFLGYLQSFQNLEYLRGAAERSRRVRCADKTTQLLSNRIAICTEKKQNPTTIEDWGCKMRPSEQIPIRVTGRILINSAALIGAEPNANSQGLGTCALYGDMLLLFAPSICSDTIRTKSSPSLCDQLHHFLFFRLSFPRFSVSPGDSSAFSSHPHCR